MPSVSAEIKIFSLWILMAWFAEWIHTANSTREELLNFCIFHICASRLGRNMVPNKRIDLGSIGDFMLSGRGWLFNLVCTFLSDNLPLRRPVTISARSEWPLPVCLLTVKTWVIGNLVVYKNHWTCVCRVTLGINTIQVAIASFFFLRIFGSFVSTTRL